MTATPLTRTVAEPAKAVKKVTLMYAGDFISTDGKRLGRWFETDGLPNDGEPFPERFSDAARERGRAYTKLKGVHAIVGDMFEFDEDESAPGTILTSTGKRVGRWQNENDRACWRAADLATDAELDARKKSKHDDLMAQLEPFRAAYRSLGPGIGRQQFLAKVVQKIVGC